MQLLSSNSLISSRTDLWTSACKARNDGFALLSEGKELPLEDMPDADEAETQILPMVCQYSLTLSPSFWPKLTSLR